MAILPKLEAPELEAVCRVLGEATTGWRISEDFNRYGLNDDSGQSTKWRRLYHVFNARQQALGNSSALGEYIQRNFQPSAFVGRAEQYASIRRELNQHLAFSGLNMRESGKLVPVKAATTLSEAERLATTLSEKLSGRNAHPEVIKYCNAELLDGNMFHAVFEAMKGLAQRIRNLTRSTKDGAALVDEAFSIKAPLLLINNLQTDSDISEHKGFAMMLKGCFGAIRNPIAHEPKILWGGMDDALDYLTHLSLLHRKLDNVRKVGRC